MKHAHHTLQATLAIKSCGSVHDVIGTLQIQIFFSTLYLYVADECQQKPKLFGFISTRIYYSNIYGTYVPPIIFHMF